MRRSLALVLVPIAFAASGCGDNSPAVTPVGVDTATTPAGPAPTQSSAPTETPSTETPTTEPSPTLIDYGAEGIEIVEPGDVALLEGAPEDFKAFAARQARKLAIEGEQCAGAFHGVTVSRLIGDFAAGSVNACGGYGAIWAKGDSGWAELLGTQEGWSCADLAAHDVPDGLVQCQ